MTDRFDGARLRATTREGIVYLRLSEFRDKEEDGLTWEVRAAELVDFATANGVNVTAANVRIENDLNGTSKSKGASGYLETLKVTTPEGLITFRTPRPVFHGVTLDLQRGVAEVLIVSTDSRASRNGRDGDDLVDAARVSGCEVWAPNADYEPDVLLAGRDRDKINEFRDRINAARQQSATISKNVRWGRQRWAGKSYAGGRRPYGYQVDTDPERVSKHHRKLVIDEHEAEVIRWAAGSILDLGVSLAELARQLRARGEPTATARDLRERGKAAAADRKAWSAKLLRDVLIKPAVAGLTPKGKVPPKGEADRRELVDAPWEPILDRARWEELRAKLTARDRRTNGANANTPRWLVTGFATCGVCGGRLRVLGGKDRAPAYAGAECAHVRRNAAAVDAHVAAEVIGRLSQPDAAGYLKPPVRERPAEVRAKLYGELADLDDAQAQTLADRSRKLITPAVAERELTRQAADRARIEAQLAAVAAQPDPLPEFREGHPAAQVWEALTIARRRAVVQTVAREVIVLRTGRHGRGFDTESVKVMTREAF
jgi:hypothetical protein